MKHVLNMPSAGKPRIILRFIFTFHNRESMTVGITIQINYLINYL